jgi:hypothetical protein
MGLSSVQFNLNMDLQLPMVDTSRGQAWWDYDYPYRRNLAYNAPDSGIEEGHPMYVYMPKDLVFQGKAQSDLSDLAMTFLEQEHPQSWRQISTSVTATEHQIIVTFPLQENLEPGQFVEKKYFLYYGNKDQLNSIVMDYEEYDQWAIELTPDSADIDYTNPGEHWEDGASDIYLAKASLLFHGDRIKMYAKVGSDQGIAELQINDEEWNMIDLYSSTEGEEKIFEITNLPLGANYIRYRVSGQKHPSSIGYWANFTKIHYAKHAVMSDSGEEADDSKAWGSSLGGMISV